MAVAFSVGVDLGGTKIAGALVDEDLNLLAFRKIPVDPERKIEKVLGDIAELSQGLLDEGKALGECAGVGLAIPGILDLKKGMLIFSENLNWRNVPIISLLKEELPVPLFMEHDVRSGTLAEVFFGQGRSLQDFIYISVGTGIAGSLVWQRQVIRGAHGTSAEVGHIIVAPGGPLCRCGNAGCLEALASGVAIERDAFHLTGKPVKGEVVFENARAGVSPYLEIVHRAAHFLGLGLFNLTQIFDPEAILIGGGIAETGNWWLEIIKENYQKHLLDSQAIPEVILGRFRSKASVMGAAAIPFLKKEGYL